MKKKSRPKKQPKKSPLKGVLGGACFETSARISRPPRRMG